MRRVIQGILLALIAGALITGLADVSKAAVRSGPEKTVIAQASTTATPAPSTTVSPTGGTQTSQGSTSVTGWILIVGAGALVLLYIYLFTWQRWTRSLTLAVLGRTGQLPTYEHVPTYIKSAFEAGGEEQAPKKLVITGPATAVLGRSSEPFKATLDGQPVPATWKTDWSRATLDPLEGPQTRVTPTKEGPLQLTATVADNPQPATANITVVAAAAAPGAVPLVGGGYGGMTIAILAITIAGALTAEGVLPAAALATLLGTVVSYFFVQRQGGQPGNGQAGGGDQRGGDM